MINQKHAAEIHLLVGFCPSLEKRKTLKRKFGLTYQTLEIHTKNGLNDRIREQICKMYCICINQLVSWSEISCYYQQLCVSFGCQLSPFGFVVVLVYLTSHFTSTCHHREKTYKLLGR